MVSVSFKQLKEYLKCSIYSPLSGFQKTITLSKSTMDLSVIDVDCCRSDAFIANFLRRIVVRLISQRYITQLKPIICSFRRPLNGSRMWFSVSKGATQLNNSVFDWNF